MALEILESGLATTVQDLGRPGHYALGIPIGGALDRRAAVVANALVGNEPGAAVLECTYLGPRFAVTVPTLLAVTGAEVQTRVNDEPQDSWTAIALAPGDVVSFGLLTAGARYYLAFSGGIDVPVVLGSRSTYALGRLGGFEHRALRAGDVVPLGTAVGGEGAGGPEPGVRAGAGATVPPQLRPRQAAEIELHVVLGLYDHRLSEQGRETLLSTDWRLTTLADRTGMRYAGATLEWTQRVQPFGAGSDQSNIVDAGYPVGSIQVPGGTEPIVLHRDAVSGGGYAMVGTVVSADLDLLAQAMPGSIARFRAVELAEALRLRAAYAAGTRAIVDAIARR